MTFHTAAEVIRMLKRKAKELGSQKSLADACDCSPAFLCDVLKSRRVPSEAMGKLFGLTKTNAVYLKGDTK